MKKQYLIRTQKINSSIVGKTFFIYSGFSFVELLVTSFIINYKVGEFIKTRKKNGSKS